MDFTGSFPAFTRSAENPPYFSDSSLFASTKPSDDRKVTSQLLIDNKDRDNAPLSDPFNFRIDLEKMAGIVYENVLTFSLKGLVFPKIIGENYVILSIEELNDDQTLHSSSPSASGKFAVAFFDNSSLAPGAIKPLKSSDLTFVRTPIPYSPALGKLSRLSICFYKPNGDPVAADGSETGGVKTSVLIFEVTTSAGRMY